METKTITILFAALALVFLVAGCAGTTQAPTGSTQSTQTGTPTGAAGGTPSAGSGTPTGGAVQPTGVKFSDSPYYAFSHLISGDTLDAAAQAAISGFSTVKTVMPDGSVEIKLTSTNPGYKNQLYTLAPGEQLYFIERSSADDTGTQDLMLGDDTAVIVDAQGFIVQK